MKKTRLLLALAPVALLLVAASASAQYYAFGKNKVQYESFRWLSLKGEHVEVFYYPEEEPLARTAIVLAEESYADLAKKFDHEVPRMVPLIVYSTHHHFEQNNVLPFFVPEGVQGFTEFMKGRVVLPYTGSYGEFRHVIHHEMVHVLFESQPFERRFRDIHTLSQQMQGHAAHFETVGQIRMGMTPERPLFTF
jgi:hypothetical protein